MGRMKEWGFQIAHMLFDREMGVTYTTETIIHREKNDGKDPDAEWVRSQVQAVYDNPDMWGYSMDYWKRLKRGFFRAGKEIRQAVTHPRQFGQKMYNSLADIAYGKHSRPKRTWGKPGK